jgi:hypothetical protein
MEANMYGEGFWMERRTTLRMGLIKRTLGAVLSGVIGFSLLAFGIFLLDQGF